MYEAIGGISVDYAIATSIDDIDFNCDNSMCGSVETSSDIDYTVKVIVDDLSSNTEYYYRFRIGDSLSGIDPIGTILCPYKTSQVS